MSGEIDMSVTDALRRDIDLAMEQSAAGHLVFDLSGVSFLDSAGLGVILGRYKKVSAAGGSVYLAGARPQVRKVMELSGLLSLMKEYPSVNQALGKSTF